ncbi:MAG: TetR/AcrR family transcriptional regulator [Proteobacteria bacterium]|nr:TetR/AcrR family transcriptional regulator [Pseudomonadota bacterium]
MKAEARKKQILDAALKAFAQHGYERTSIAVICEKAGIARPTLYQYFNDKRSVFRELLENYLLGIHEKIHERKQAANDKESLSKRETMQSAHKNLVEEISHNRDFYRILFKEAKAKNTETEDIVKGMMHMIRRELVGEMRAERVLEGMSEQDLEFAVVYMMGGLMQTVEYYLLDREHPLSSEEIADKITFIESRIKGV